MKGLSRFALAGVLFLAVGVSAGQRTPAPAPTTAPAPTAGTTPVAPEATEACREATIEELEARLAALQAQVEMANSESVQSVEGRLADFQDQEGALKAELAALDAQAEAPAVRVEAPEPPEQPDPGVALTVDDDSGYLGVDIADVSSDKAKELKLADVHGVLIEEVEKDSPASKAGLAAGDVILEYNHQRVESAIQFRRMVRETPQGRSVQLTVWRNGATQEITAELGQRGRLEGRTMYFRMPPVKVEPREFAYSFTMPELAWGMRPMLGVDAEDLNGQLAEYFGVPGGEGVLIRYVHSGTPAERAGVKAGDVITKVDDQPVKNIGDLRDQLHAKRDNKSVKLDVLRKGSSVTLNVELEQPKKPEPLRSSRRATF